MGVEKRQAFPQRELENRIKRLIIPPSTHAPLATVSQIEHITQSSLNRLFNGRISCFCGEYGMQRDLKLLDFFFSNTDLARHFWEPRN